MASDRGDLYTTWREIRPSVAMTGSAVLLASMSLICAIGLIATSAWLISRAWEQPPILYLTVAVVAVRAFGIGRGVFRYLDRLVSHSAALQGLGNLRGRLVAHISVVSPAGVAWLRPGDAVRRLVDDVDTAAEFGLRTVLPRRTAMLVGLVVVGLMAWLLPLAALWLLVGLLIAGVAAPVVTAFVSARGAARDIDTAGQLATQTVDLMNGLPDLVAAGIASRSVQRISSLDADLAVSQRRTAVGLAAGSALTIAAQAIALLGVIVAAVPAVSSGALNGVNLAVVVLVPLVAFEIISPLAAAAIARARAGAASRRIQRIATAPNVVPDPVSPLGLPVGSELVVDNVSITWPGERHPAVDRVSFRVKQGQRLALLGPSGSGKSSLAAALVKFVATSGDIRLGEVSYADLTGDDVRQRVVLCEQSPYIFDNTILENVRFARPAATETDVAEALRLAQLTEWIARQPAGIHTQVGEHGYQLSGGQRQRLALARAVLTAAPIVILDEPTAHVDDSTSEALLDDFFEVLAGRTIVLITHDRRQLHRVDDVVELAMSSR